MIKNCCIKRKYLVFVKSIIVIIFLVVFPLFTVRLSDSLDAKSNYFISQDNSNNQNVHSIERIDKSNISPKSIINMKDKKIQYNYSISINNFKIYKKEDYYLIDINGFNYKFVPGLPITPFKQFIFELPFRSELIELDVDAENKVHINISPNEILHASPIYAIDNEVLVSISSSYEPSLYEVVFNGYFRNHRILVINVYPIQYDLDNDIVFAYKEILIRISYSIQHASRDFSPIDVFDRFLKKSDVITLPSDKEYETGASLYLSEEDSYILGVPIDLLIIAPRKFYDETNQLKLWKERNGIRTIIKTIEDIKAFYSGRDLQEKIRNCIKDYYYKNNIKWVLLLGDADIIPPRYVYVKDAYIGDGDFVPSDYYYAGLDGTWDTDGDGIYGEDQYDIDWFPEVIVGRVPINTIDELKSQINKIKEFEQYMENKSIWKHAILAGAYSNYDNDKDGDDILDWKKTDEAKLNYYIMKRFLQPNGFSFTRLYEVEGLDPTDYEYDLPLNINNMINVISNGSLFINLAGHGSITEIWRKVWVKDYDGDGLADENTSPDGDEHEWYYYLNKTDKLNTTSPYYPIIYIDACNTGYFDFDEDSLAEFLLKKIGIGVIASARVSWYQIDWDPLLDGGSYNQGLDYRFWEYLINHTAISPATALYLAKIDYIHDIGLDPSNSSKKNLLSYNYFGDPSIMVYLNRGSKSTEWIIDSPTTIRNETLFISNNITIKSSLKIINSTIIFNSTGLIEIKVDSLANLEIQNSRLLNKTGRFYIIAYTQANLVINNSIIRGAGDEAGIGIWLFAENTIINNSLFMMSEKAIYAVIADNLTIQNSRFYRNWDGLYIGHCENVTIINSIFEENVNGGARIWSSINLTIQNSRFYHNGDGLYIRQCKNVTITNSVFEENSDRGARVDESILISVVNSMFSKNDIFGLNLYNNTNVDVIGTRFYSDQLWIMGNLTALLTLKIIGCTKDDKQILYLINEDNIMYQFSTYGQVIFAYCNYIYVDGILNSTLTFYKVNKVEISNSTITNSDAAIALWYVNDIIIDSVNLKYNDYGIRIGWSANITIRNTIIMESNYAGIISYFSEQIVMERSKLYNNLYYGISITGGDKNICIDRNEFRSSRVSIGVFSYYGNISNIIITNNSVIEISNQSDESWGITLEYVEYDVNEVLISDNAISNKSKGIGVWSYGNIHNVTIKRNKIINSSIFGIGIINAQDTILIDNNYVFKSQKGIYISLSNNVYVTNNLLENNTYGIDLINSTFILVYGNCLVYNSIQARDNRDNKWNTTNIGNFWSNYIGDDVNKDGIIDMPYQIDSDSIDYYPLMFCNILNDSVSPVITIINPVNNTITNQKTLLVQFKVNEYYLREIHVLINESIVFKLYTTEIAINLNIPEDGVWKITVYATDFRNNSDTKYIYITYDTTPPYLALIDPDNQTILSVSTITVSWTANDNLSGIDHFSLMLDSGDWINISDCSYVFASLTDGEHIIIIRAYDLVGNFNEIVVVCTIDTVSPILIVAGLENYTVLRSADVSLTWNAWDEISGVAYYLIIVDSSIVLNTTDTNYTLSELTEGSHSIVIKAYDYAGNYAQCIIIFSVEFKKEIISPEIIGLIVLIAVILFLASYIVIKKRRSK